MASIDLENIHFYNGPSAIRSQPRFPDALTSIVSGKSFTPHSAHQTALHFDPRYQTWEERLSSDQRYRNDNIQDQAVRYSTNNNKGNDVPAIPELLSRVNPDNVLASVNSNCDDSDEFPDIDELLASIQQKSVSASAKSNFCGLAETADDGTRVGSPVASRFTRGSTQDPIILSDDESMGAESATDYSHLDVGLATKRDSHSSHMVNSDRADGDGCSSGTTLTSDHLVANHHDDSNGNDNDVVDGAKAQLIADCPRSASPGHGSTTYQTGAPQVNSEVTQGNASYVDLDVAKEVEDKGIDVAKGNDDDDASTRSKKRSRLSAISWNNSASDSNTSISMLQAGQHDSIQSLQLGPVVASLQKPGWTKDSLPKHRYRRDATKSVRRKRPRHTAPTELASAAGTVSAALESTDLEESQSGALITALGQERELKDDQEMVDSRSIDDSKDKDYRKVCNATGPKIKSRPHPRKRIKRAKITKYNSIEAVSTCPSNVSYQATAVTSSDGMLESEEIPVHGYFTLKTIASKVVYCLTFSQELLPRSQDSTQKQDSPTDLEELQSVAPVADANHLWGICKIVDQKVVDDEKHYKVKWEDTWMPESELAGARKLINEFEGKLQHAQSETREGRQNGPEAKDHLVNQPSDARSEKATKKRGRPRKQK